MLSQPHDSNVWAQTFHHLGHLLLVVSASNDHMTRFWARERPADAAPACLCPAPRHAYRCGPRRQRRRRARGRGRCTCCARLRQLRSVAVPGTRGGWLNSADTVGGVHGGVSSGTDDDTVPGFGGSSSEVPGLGSGGGGFGGGAGSGSGLMANARGRQNGPLMSWAAAMDGQGPRGGRQADDRA